MHFREAILSDVDAMHQVRMAVKENILLDAGKVTHNHYQQLLHHNGKGWVCEADGQLIGFAIADLSQQSIWALFVLPEYEGHSVGGRLHDLMVNWCFAQGLDQLTLTTDPTTRAERFYLKKGWTKQERLTDGELQLTLSKEHWHHTQA